MGENDLGLCNDALVLSSMQVIHVEDMSALQAFDRLDKVEKGLCGWCCITNKLNEKSC
jgi:hypothetical protein